ncbi:ABC transporter substrate-binding protein [Paracoccus pacificus]|uniref:ABC transporter substrate-binding protein n=1 Tax=Paracoccus pacificus TaxID=1463598 RepID=A0ABW4R862_9RHOB
MVRLAITVAVLLTGVSAALADAPAPDAPNRVVSMNLCTDQLAMLIAAPGQVVSVSALARDPQLSLMADQARELAVNHGRAEEVYLLTPDLVLAEPYSATAAVQMLTRLGVRVETVPSVNSIADLRDGILRMGALLGRPERAAQVLADFDSALADVPKAAPRLATTYAANGFAAGRRSLPGDVLRRAGYTLLTDQLGRPYGGSLPLELLVLADPDLIVTGSRYAQPSRAEGVLDHPALAGLTAERRVVPDRDWICGLPHLAEVVAGLAR